MDFFSENICISFFLFFCRSLKMAVLLIFVILLHLLTLAMLFIATMEKVVMGGLTGHVRLETHVSCPVLCVSFLFPVLVGVGRTGKLRPVVQLPLRQLHRNLVVRVLQRNW